MSSRDVEIILDIKLSRESTKTLEALEKITNLMTKLSATGLQTGGTVEGLETINQKLSIMEQKAISVGRIFAETFPPRSPMEAEEWDYITKSIGRVNDILNANQKILSVQGKMLERAFLEAVETMGKGGTFREFGKLLRNTAVDATSSIMAVDALSRSLKKLGYSVPRDLLGSFIKDLKRAPKRASLEHLGESNNRRVLRLL